MLYTKCIKFSTHFLHRTTIIISIHCPQVTLDSFTLGRFVSYTENGCPDGYLQVSEAKRANVGGMWCGTTWGPAIFYSETDSLVMTIKLFK